MEGSRNRKGALVVRKIDDNDDKSIWYDPFKVDIWMLGMTYLEMRLGSGRRPWKYAVVEEYGFHEYVRRPDRVYQRLRYQGMGSAEVRLVMKMLKIKPEERVDVWQVMDDVWFRSLDGKCRHRMPKY